MQNFEPRCDGQREVYDIVIVISCSVCLILHLDKPIRISCRVFNFILLFVRSKAILLWWFFLFFVLVFNIFVLLVLYVCFHVFS